jgi:hypothetical protein
MSWTPYGVTDENTHAWEAASGDAVDPIRLDNTSASSRK